MKRAFFEYLIVAVLSLIVGLVLIALTGCAEAVRTYHYGVTTAPDGTVTKSIDVTIKNSDVKVGQLEASAQDGMTIKLTDLDAQERATLLAQTQADVIGKAIDKLPVPGIP
jgi:hypothetical protein